MSLRKTTELVHDILIKNAAARDSDDELYIKVLDYYGVKLGVDFGRISATSFFKYYRKYRIPSIETVGRCRRKLQEEYAELAANSDVTFGRMERESEFVHYAREGLQQRGGVTYR